MREDGRLEAFVAPVMLDRRHPLAGVDGVNNALLVHGDLTGDIMLYGQGAGMIPTGGAIVSDIIRIYGRGDPGRARNACWDRGAALAVSDFSEYSNGHYARVETPDAGVYAKTLFREIPEARILPKFAGEPAGCCAFTAPQGTEGEFAGALSRVNEAVKGSETKFVARLPQKRADI